MLFLFLVCFSFVLTSEKWDFVKQYAPKIYLHSKEEYKPSSIDFFLQNTKRVGDRAITKKEMSSATEKLDFFYGQNVGDAPLYAFVLPGRDEPDPVLAIDNPSQHTVKVIYFSFYPYNKGYVYSSIFGSYEIGNHVGDIEEAIIIFEKGIPKKVSYAAHGEKFPYTDWDDFQKEGDNIFLYAALGSHASYKTTKECLEHRKDFCKKFPPIIPCNPDNWLDRCEKGQEWNAYENVDVITPYDWSTKTSEVKGWEGFKYLLFVHRWGNLPAGLLGKEKDVRQLDEGPTGFLGESDIQDLINGKFKDKFCMSEFSGVDCKWPAGYFSDRYTEGCLHGFLHVTDSRGDYCMLQEYLPTTSQCSAFFAIAQFFLGSCSSANGCGVGWNGSCHGSCFFKYCYSDCIVKKQGSDLVLSKEHIICDIGREARTLDEYNKGAISEAEVTFNTGTDRGGKDYFDCKRYRECAAVYPQSDYQGKKLEVCSDFPSLSKTVVGHGISSAKMGDEIAVFFSEENFLGDSITFPNKTEVDNFKDFGFNDDTRSIKLYNEESCVRLYTSDGDEFEYVCEFTSVKKLRFNDQIGSIKIGDKNLFIDVYESSKWRHFLKRIHADETLDAGMKNEISSARVFPSSEFDDCLFVFSNSKMEGECDYICDDTKNYDKMEVTSIITGWKDDHFYGLFSGNNYDGEAIFFSGKEEIHDLGDNGYSFNDKAHSFKVFINIDDCVVFYEYSWYNHGSKEGKSEIMCFGYDVKKVRYNDAYKSVKVGGNVEASTFKDTDFGKDEKTYSENTPEFDSFKISSVKIRKKNKDDCAEFFIDPNYEGKSEVICLGEGENVRKVRYNDAYSSVKIGENVEAYAYKHSNFGGVQQVKYSEDTPAIDILIMNNEISSVMIRPKNKDDCATFYENANYGGRCEVICFGHDVEQVLYNDAYSSVKIGKNVEALAFIHSKFEGDDRKPYFESNDDFVYFNNKISSVKILKKDDPIDEL